MATKTKKPNFRKLKGYAFDPSLSLKIDTAFINNIIYKVIWEDNLEPGPIGEYIEIIDFDPTINQYYSPVDLNNANLLAQDGLDPAETNPQFHQQMVYAVIMTTINNFETALGRRILWAPRKTNFLSTEEYVGRLRIYPHALREANAYYSPQKKSLLFGYFESSPADSTIHMPNSFVFTCLSHDIVAHEVTHAILDGMHPYFSTPSNPDVLAFHEAFADIVALFQHFTFPEVLRHQIAKTQGDLASQNLLGELAQEFSSAIGNYGALRSAIGKVDPTSQKWKQHVPSGDEYNTILEPHLRGSILVSAVFEAFLTIYRNRIKDLLRLASGGTGILPKGELQPDLVNRLANEASKSAKHVLNICIRALDYCPPVDITFGDFLRAIITSDIDIISEDSLGYRLAFIDAFRRRGIYPQGLKTYSISSLEFNSLSSLSIETKNLFEIIVTFLREYRNAVTDITERKDIYTITRDYILGNWNEDKMGLHKRIYSKFDNRGEFERVTGLVFNEHWKELGIRTLNYYGENEVGPSFQIHNLRVVTRTGPNGTLINRVIFSLVQQSGVEVCGDTIKHFEPGGEMNENQIVLYGGCTMIFDLDTRELKYAVSKPLLNIDKLPLEREIDTERITRQYTFQKEEGLENLSAFNKYFGAGINNNYNEPFAFLHK